MKQICDIWQTSFNEKCTKYHIEHLLQEDYSSCTYIIDGGKELRMTVNRNAYNFCKILRSKTYKYVAKISDCFVIELPNQYNEMQNVFCIASESLDRDFASQAIKQSGINLFRDCWCKYLSKNRRLDSNPYIDIEDAYSMRDVSGRDFVKKRIHEADVDSIAKDVALAMDGAYCRIKELDSASILFPLKEYIGIGSDGIIKICNIGHQFMGLDGDYEIDTAPNSVTIKYSSNDSIDTRMLMPLSVVIEGHERLVMGQIDTGAYSSGFTEFFFKEASLENFGLSKTSGVTGQMDSIITACVVKFPNGYTTPLYGFTYRESDNVSILIGMDLLSRCKFESEPYRNGFKYKITFL